MFSKFKIFQSVRAHFRKVPVFASVAMIVLNDWIKEFVKYFVSTGRAGIYTDTIVIAGSASRDTCLELDAVVAFLVFVVVPEFAR